jgi:hypothetical protein
MFTFIEEIYYENEMLVNDVGSGPVRPVGVGRR